MRARLPCTWRLLWGAAAVLVATPLAVGMSNGERLLVDRPEFRVWLLYPPEKVFKRQTLATNTRAERIRLSAARGEFEPFVIVLRPHVPRTILDVRFECESIRHVGSTKGPPLTLTYRRIGYVHVDQPSGTSVLPSVGERFKATAIPFGSTGRTGYVPDRLVPDPLAFADPGQNTQFWFTLTVPTVSAPGLHRGMIALRCRGVPDVRILVEVTVFDFALPRSPTLRNTTCWSPQLVSPPLEKRELKALYRDMALHRQTPDPVLPQPTLRIDKDGRVEVDTKDYDEMVEFCMNGLGLRHLFFPHAGLAWYTNVYFLWQSPAVRKQRWHGVPVFGPDLEATPRFQKAFGRYVKWMTDHFRRKGWLDRVYMTTMDEPHRPDDFQAIRGFGQVVKAIAPDVRLFCTTYPRPELIGTIAAWCPQQYDEAIVRERQAKGEELMFYKNWLHLIDMPMVNPRLLGWIAWRVKAVGWLTYATMGRWERAWDEPYALYANTGIKAWGLGLWWYPDPVEQRILTSVRWEIMREGAEDYEYLALLAKRLDALPEASRQRPEAKAAAAFLRSATDGILLYPRVLSWGPDKGWESKPNFTQSHRVVWQRRNRAARLIEALGKLGAASTQG